MRTAETAAPVGGTRPTSLRSISRAAGALVCVVVSLALTLGNASPASANVLAPPSIPLIPSLAGSGAGGAVGGGIAGGTGAAGSGAVAGAAATGALAVGAVALFGATAWGTQKVLHWAFDNPPTAGTQPSAGLSAGYQTSAGNPYDPFGVAVRSIGSCRSTGTSFDPAVTGWSNIYSTCFSNGNTISNQGSGNVTINMPAWRCKVANCGNAVRIVDPINTGTPTQLLSSALSLPGFAATTGSAGSHTTTVSIGAPGYTYYGWDLWYDPAQIEWTPPAVNSLKTTTTCKNKTTGALTTTSTVSANFYGAEVNNIDLGPAVGACPSTATTVSSKIELCGSAGASCSDILYQWQAVPRTIDPSPTDPYKNCLPGGSAAPCTLKLYKSTSSGWKLCDSASDCHTFDPDTSTSAQYKCEWGAYAVPLVECAPLKQWTATTVANVGQDPDPAPGDGTATNPSTNPSPSASASAPGIPTSGENPTAPPNPFDPTVPDPGGQVPNPEGQNCWGSGWSWNPISWVYVPVKCALSWAFVPKPGFLNARMTGLKDSFGGTIVGSYLTPLSGLVTIPSAENCNGIHVHYSMGVAPHAQPFDEYLGKACAGDTLESAAHICKMVTSALLVLGGGWSCICLVVNAFFPHLIPAKMRFGGDQGAEDAYYLDKMGMG